MQLIETKLAPAPGPRPRPVTRPPALHGHRAAAEGAGPSTAPDRVKHPALPRCNTHPPAKPPVTESQGLRRQASFPDRGLLPQPRGPGPARPIGPLSSILLEIEAQAAAAAAQAASSQDEDDDGEWWERAVSTGHELPAPRQHILWQGQITAVVGDQRFHLLLEAYSIRQQHQAQSRACKHVSQLPEQLHFEAVSLEALPNSIQETIGATQSGIQAALASRPAPPVIEFTAPGSANPGSELFQPFMDLLKLLDSSRKVLALAPSRKTVEASQESSSSLGCASNVDVVSALQLRLLLLSWRGLLLTASHPGEPRRLRLVQLRVRYPASDQELTQSHVYMPEAQQEEEAGCSSGPTSSKLAWDKTKQPTSSCVRRQPQALCTGSLQQSPSQPPSGRPTVAPLQIPPADSEAGTLAPPPEGSKPYSPTENRYGPQRPPWVPPGLPG